MAEDTKPCASPYAGTHLFVPLRLGSATAADAQSMLVTKTAAQIAHIYERGRTIMVIGDLQNALRIMRNVTRIAPDHANAWRDYAALLRHAARDIDAEEAETRAAAESADAWPRLHGEQDASELRRLDEDLYDQVFALPEEKRASWLREKLRKIL